MVGHGSYEPGVAAASRLDDILAGLSVEGNALVEGCWTIFPELQFSLAFVDIRTVVPEVKLQGRVVNSRHGQLMPFGVLYPVVEIAERIVGRTAQIAGEG